MCGYQFYYLWTRFFYEVVCGKSTSPHEHVIRPLFRNGSQEEACCSYVSWFIDSHRVDNKAIRPFSINNEIKLTSKYILYLFIIKWFPQHHIEYDKNPIHFSFRLRGCMVVSDNRIIFAVERVGNLVTGYPGGRPTSIVGYPTNVGYPTIVGSPPYDRRVG